MGRMTFSEHDKFETIDRAQIIQFFSIPALLNPTCSFSLKKINFLRNFKTLFSNAAYEFKLACIFLYNNEYSTYYLIQALCFQM